MQAIKLIILGVDGVDGELKVFSALVN